MTGVDHPTDHGMTTNYTQTHAVVILDIGRTKSLNHAPHQLCSGARMMTRVEIYYPTILWVLYEAWAMSDKLMLPHRPRHDLQLHHIHAQLVPWILEPRASWTVVLISGVVVQWWWRRYWYGITLFYECYMRHGPGLTGVDHPTDHIMTINFTTDMHSCYSCFQNQDHLLYTSSMA